MVAPAGAFGSLAGGMIGKKVAESLGYDGGNGYLVGSLIGGAGVTGASAFARKLGGVAGAKGAAKKYAARAMSYEIVPAAAAGAYGYATTGDVTKALHYAALGAAAGGIVGAIRVKCFVAGTPVWVPVPAAMAQGPFCRIANGRSHGIRWPSRDWYWCRSDYLSLIRRTHRSQTNRRRGRRKRRASRARRCLWSSTRKLARTCTDSMGRPKRRSRKHHEASLWLGDIVTRRQLHRTTQPHTKFTTFP